MRDPQKQSKEMSKTWEPAQQLRDGAASLSAATQLMAQHARNAQAALTGIDATATVVAVRQTGSHINLQPVVELDLTVIREGRPPYPVLVRQPMEVHQLAQITPGASLRVKVDPGDPAVVWIAGG